MIHFNNLNIHESIELLFGFLKISNNKNNDNHINGFSLPTPTDSSFKILIEFFEQNQSTKQSSSKQKQQCILFNCQINGNECECNDVNCEQFIINRKCNFSKCFPKYFN